MDQGAHRPTNLVPVDLARSLARIRNQRGLHSRRPAHGHLIGRLPCAARIDSKPPHSMPGGGTSKHLRGRLRDRLRPRLAQVSGCQPDVKRAPATYSAPIYMVTPALNRPDGPLFAPRASEHARRLDCGVGLEIQSGAIVPETQTLGSQRAPELPAVGSYIGFAGRLRHTATQCGQGRPILATGRP